MAAAATASHQPPGWGCSVAGQVRIPSTSAAPAVQERGGRLSVAWLLPAWASLRLAVATVAAAAPRSLPRWAWGAAAARRRASWRCVWRALGLADRRSRGHAWRRPASMAKISSLSTAAIACRLCCSTTRSVLLAACCRSSAAACSPCSDECADSRWSSALRSCTSVSRRDTSSDLFC